MLKLDLFSTAEGEGRRGPACVLDLAPIDVALRERRDGLVRKHGADLFEEGSPNGKFCLLGELVEVQGDVDAREEGVVEGLDPVRGQEEDAAVVLDVPEASVAEPVSGYPERVSGS